MPDTPGGTMQIRIPGIKKPVKLPKWALPAAGAVGIAAVILLRGKTASSESTAAEDTAGGGLTGGETPTYYPTGASGYETPTGNPMTFVPGLGQIPASYVVPEVSAPFPVNWEEATSNIFTGSPDSQNYNALILAQQKASNPPPATGAVAPSTQAAAQTALSGLLARLALPAVPTVAGKGVSATAAATATKAKTNLVTAARLTGTATLSTGAQNLMAGRTVAAPVVYKQTIGH